MKSLRNPFVDAVVVFILIYWLLWQLSHSFGIHTFWENRTYLMVHLIVLYLLGVGFVSHFKERRNNKS